MELAAPFEAERPRLTRLAARILGDPVEAEDIVQQAWLRLDRNGPTIDDLPAWLTTVTTRLCLDRLRSRAPVPMDDVEVEEQADDAGASIELAESVGVALHVVLDKLSPKERVAFVLHDSFGFEFATVAQILGTTPAAARQLGSRARAKVRAAGAHDDANTGHTTVDHPSDAAVVDAFMAAARGGDLRRLIALLAPDARVGADAAAVALGTPERIEGGDRIAAFFDGSAHAALPVLVAGRPGAAWFHRGEAKVLFDFTIAGGRVQSIEFRADPDLLSAVRRRRATPPEPGPDTDPYEKENR